MLELNVTYPSTINGLVVEGWNAIDCRYGIHNVASGGTVIYGCHFQHGTVLRTSKAGIRTTGGVYNEWRGIDSYVGNPSALAFDMHEMSPTLHNLRAEGCSYLDIPFGRVENWATEHVPIGGPGDPDTALSINRIGSFGQIILDGCGPATYGVAITGSAYDGQRIHFTGVSIPRYPVFFGGSASGSIQSVTREATLGKHFDPLRYTPGELWQANRIVNAGVPDALSVTSYGWAMKRVAALPEPSEKALGLMRVLEGRRGVADELKCLLKDARGAAGWATVS